MVNQRWRHLSEVGLERQVPRFAYMTLKNSNGHPEFLGSSKSMAFKPNLPDETGSRKSKKVTNKPEILTVQLLDEARAIYTHIDL